MTGKREGDGSRCVMPCEEDYKVKQMKSGERFYSFC